MGDVCRAALPLNDELAAQTKLALRRLASAVAVVTCRDGEARHAMTATAVNAMSMEPPSMIVCVNRSSRSMPRSAAPSSFAINILHRNQERDFGGMRRQGARRGSLRLRRLGRGGRRAGAR